MAMEYRCSNCEARYSRNEFNALDTQLVDENNEKFGYEGVCERCGKGMHSERWQLIEEVGDVTVSTVGLVLGHGIERNLWYETCVFGEDGGSNIVRRYETKEEAKEGHEKEIGKHHKSKESKKREAFRFDKL